MFDEFFWRGEMTFKKWTYFLVNEIERFKTQTIKSGNVGSPSTNFSISLYFSNNWCCRQEIKLIKRKSQTIEPLTLWNRTVLLKFSQQNVTMQEIISAYFLTRSRTRMQTGLACFLSLELVNHGSRNIGVLETPSSIALGLTSVRTFTPERNMVSSIGSATRSGNALLQCHYQFTIIKGKITMWDTNNEQIFWKVG